VVRSVVVKVNDNIANAEGIRANAPDLSDAIITLVDEPFLQKAIRPFRINRQQRPYLLKNSIHMGLGPIYFYKYEQSTMLRLSSNIFPISVNRKEVYSAVCAMGI